MVPSGSTGCWGPSSNRRGMLRSASWTLKEEAPARGSFLTAESWKDYPILSFAEIPSVEVDVVDASDESTGVGEASPGTDSRCHRQCRCKRARHTLAHPADDPRSRHRSNDGLGLTRISPRPSSLWPSSTSLSGSRCTPTSFLEYVESYGKRFRSLIFYFAGLATARAGIASGVISPSPVDQPQDLAPFIATSATSLSRRSNLSPAIDT